MPVRLVNSLKSRDQGWLSFISDILTEPWKMVTLGKQKCTKTEKHRVTLGTTGNTI